MLELQKTKINNREVGYYDVSGLSRSEWLSFRSWLGRIGGSDVGTICGVNKFKDGYTLFLEKIGLKGNNFSGNKYTTIGSFLETEIRNMWCYGNDLHEITTNYNNGIKIREAHDPYVTYVSDDMPWFAANTDGLITKDPKHDYLGTGVLEIKKISGRASDSYEGGIPPAYIYQLQAYMWSVRALYGYIAAFVGEADFISQFYELDEEIVETIIEKCTRFYDAVQEGKKVMAKNLKNKEKLEELYMIEDTFADVICAQNWDEINKWLLEPINIDERINSVKADEALIEMAEEYDRRAKEYVEAKNSKQEIGGKLKLLMQRKGANESVWDGGKVKFNKRLSVKIFEE